MSLVGLEGPSDGPTNMARDASLFERAEQGETAARVYGWDGPWVSFGRFQDPVRSVRACDVPTVQRPTGGKAVLHGHDVTVGLALPLAALGLDEYRSRSVGPVYRKVVAIVIAGLRETGVSAELGEQTRFVRERRHLSDCFAAVSANDIVDPQSGQKVCGCALRIGERAVLLQASVPCGPPLVDPLSVFERPGPVSWRPLDAQDFAAELERALFQSEWPGMRNP